MKSKSIVAGLGEIGRPIRQLIARSGGITVGFDADPRLVSKNELAKHKNLPTAFLHVCIPYNKKFLSNVVLLDKQFSPKIIVLHSTVRPYTTQKLQGKLSVPVVYSATRGTHKRMSYDLRRYTKFFAIEEDAPNRKWATSSFVQLMRKCNVKTRRMSKPISLELAKLVCDTSYYGWLINYAQLSNMIAVSHKVDYDEMWSFSDEIHKFLGNRPKMFPGHIGGHCVIPNLDLMENKTLDLIKSINASYVKKIPGAKSINKKYDKSKKQSYSLQDRR